MNGTRVANDALGVFLAVCAVAVALSLVVNGGRRVILHGLAAGLLDRARDRGQGDESRPSAVPRLLLDRGLVPGASSRSGSAALVGAAMAAGCLAIVQAELRFNLEHYGFSTSMQEAVINHRKGLTYKDLIATAARIPWSQILLRLWDRELFYTAGWSFLMTSPAVTRFYRVVIQLGLLGWVWLSLARTVNQQARDGPEIELGGSRLLDPRRRLHAGAGVSSRAIDARVGHRDDECVVCLSQHLPWFLAIVRWEGSAGPWAGGSGRPCRWRSRGRGWRRSSSASGG